MLFRRLSLTCLLLFCPFLSQLAHPQDQDQDQTQTQANLRVHADPQADPQAQVPPQAHAQDSHPPLPEPIIPEEYRLSHRPEVISRDGTYRPTRVDHRRVQSPIRDQGYLNSCVCFASIAAMEALIEEDIDLSEWHAFIEFNGVRRLSLEGPRLPYISSWQVVWRVLRLGVCEEESLPYPDTYTQQHLPKGVWDPVEIPPRWRVRDFIWLSEEEAKDPSILEGFLAAGYCIPMSLEWPLEELESSSRDGLLRANGEDYGKHATLFVGYDREDRVFIFRNSMGENWGDDGYGRVPYDYVRDRARDTFVILSVEEMGAESESLEAESLETPGTPEENLDLLGLPAPGQDIERQE